MNLEELRSVQRAERQKDSLQHLPDSFYADVADRVAQLKDERQRAVEAADDPFSSDDVRQLTDEIESTTEVANALYERRVGKVVKHASFAAADMATDEEGMTTEERDLFEDLVARIRENRKTVLATLEGARETPSESVSPPTDDPGSAAAATDPGAPGETAATATDADAPGEAADADGLLADALGDAETASEEAPSQSPAAQSDATTEPVDAGAPDDDRPTAEPAAATGTSTKPSESTNGTAATDTAPPTDGSRSAATDGSTDGRASANTDRTTLRITADVGTVYGVDEREYDLAREDVVDLPTTNAEPLLQKNAAERID